MPEENTAILSPNTHDLVVLLILGTAIAVVGFFLSGGLELFRNLLRKKHTEEPKESVPKTDIGFDSTAIAKIPAKQWVPRLAAWLLAFVAVILFVKFFLTSGAADLDEFRDEIDGWVIDAIKAIGIDTAKAVLNAPREMLIEKTDLEEETVDEVLRILKSEFEEGEN